MAENEENSEELVWDNTIKVPDGTCPVCGEESLVRNGHCETCYSCGYSLCSL